MQVESSLRSDTNPLSRRSALRIVLSYLRKRTNHHNHHSRYNICAGIYKGYKHMNTYDTQFFRSLLRNIPRINPREVEEHQLPLCNRQKYLGGLMIIS